MDTYTDNDGSISIVKSLKQTLKATVQHTSKHTSKHASKCVPQRVLLCTAITAAVQ
jgi:hypothetical protein